MGDEDHRAALLPVQPDHFLLHVPPDQRVERAERLVEEEDFGVDGQSPCQTDALALTAGELGGSALFQARQPDLGDDLGGPLAAFRPAHALDLQAVGDVVEDGAVRQQAEVLEDHRGPVPAQGAQPGPVHGADVLAVDDDGAGGRLDQPGETAHQCGLAGAGQAHDDEDLALADVEGHIADGGRAAGAGAQFGRVEGGEGGVGGDPAGLGAEDLPQAVHGEDG
ncbi:hypothetical protein SHKM778_10730 [Streptomyces sp. KM77-8]|uniref:Uncharacterized protein n=1 Tax=Streptomyces haneummycinicus TaxID=3074435 RepID=A0AAT9HBA0_9ACTN